MTVRAPFQGINGANQVLTSGAASASVAINAVSKSVRLVNAGSNICYVRIGLGSQTATVSDFPVLPNSAVVVQKADGDNTLSHISAAGTTLNVQPGEGGV